VNLALPLFAASEPLPMKKEKFKDIEWSIWDRWVLRGDFTVQARCGPAYIPACIPGLNVCMHCTARYTSCRLCSLSSPLRLCAVVDIFCQFYFTSVVCHVRYSVC
jgi:hypothetical protein